MTGSKVALILHDFNRVAPDEGTLPALPALQLLLSRGRCLNTSDDHTGTTFSLFRLGAEEERDLPAAAISALGDGLPAESGWWLRADLVHMVADRDQLYLSASEIIDLSQQEADALIDELNALYRDDGWQFFAATPRRWYLRLPSPLSMRTTPTHRAVGQRVGEVLPKGDDALIWQRTMTEIQMLLHASAVNQQREERGELSVNSLWFWGGGELPQASMSGDWQHVASDEPLVRGMARLHGLSCEATSLPQSRPGSSLLCPARVDSLEHAEQTLFAPLLARMKAGEVSELQLHLSGVGSWVIDSAMLRRWWKFRRPLQQLLRV